MKQNKVTRLAESAVLIALATVLSILRLIELPYGGSVTAASMLPVILIAYRYGCGWGTLSGVVFGIVQTLLGLHVFSYVTTWQSVIAVLLLDYLVAFCVLGVAGVFRRAGLSQTAALALGTLLACFLRYLCHVVSGATVWAGLSIPDEAAILYSVGYNLTYMLPETVVTLFAAIYLSSMLDFSAPIPGRRKGGLIFGARSAVSPLWIVFGSTLFLFGLAFSTVSVFSHLQSADTGLFDGAGLTEMNLPLVLLLGGGALLLGAALIAVGVMLRRKNANK